jgi:long-subunit acyl-CoA synthetase (AMP-forming)
MALYRNVVEAFWEQVKSRKASDPALAQKRNGSWEITPWSAYGEKVGRISSALANAGFKPGEKIAIFSDNCPEWLIADFGILNAGMISVPLYPNQTEEQVRYILEHSESSAVFVRGAERLRKLKDISSLRKIIVIGASDGAAAGAPIQDFHDFVGSGNVTGKADRAAQLQGNAIATIVYTSGTTAFPKGVLLTHDNLISEAWMLNQRSLRTHADIVLSYLPLSHVAERLNQLRQAVKGYSIWFGQGLDTVAQDLREVRPTSFVGVPRVYEKFQEGIVAAMSGVSPRRRALFEKTLVVGRQYLVAKKEGRVSPLLALRAFVLRGLVGKKGGHADFLRRPRDEDRRGIRPDRMHGRDPLQSGRCADVRHGRPASRRDEVPDRGGRRNSNEGRQRLRRLS